MNTKPHTTASLRPAMPLLLASGLLLAVWAMGTAHAQQKKDLIEMPLIQQFKEEKAAAAAAAAEASAAKSKTGVVTPAAKAVAAVAPPVAIAQVPKPATTPVTPVKPATPASAPAGTTAPAAAQKQSAAAAVTPPAPAAVDTGPAASGTVKQLREALSAIGTPNREAGQRTTVRIAPPASSGNRAGSTQNDRQAQRARALALARGESLPSAPGKDGQKGEVHWSYEGIESGPEAWGKLKPEYSLCATGKRQSPIAISGETTLQGPAEPIGFSYQPSTGTVVNNGHTVQVDLEGENSLTVRNSTYKLLQFHFHTPSEVMVNSRRSDMAAHLVHRNEAGQLAVVAVLLERGEPNTLVDTVWTYMPLGPDDKVRLPADALDLNRILPSDKRYYQFFGSLTTPPCTEGVLWLVMKQPVTISPAQFRLFSQQFPFNARPVQPLHGRVVREAM